MREIIKINIDACTGCNRCGRECPMEMANIAYQDKKGDIKVKLDNSKCIACGRCVSACKHDARQYDDDTARFFDDLKNGVKISLIAAPSIRTNIHQYKRLFSYLKKMGVNKIYDVSLGADICIWGHLKHIQNNFSHSIITQPCPVIVSYCEIYRHDLLKHLSPIQSPMVCTAVYMRNYEGIGDKIAALSPCVAKANEFDETGLPHYNVTFEKLFKYLKDNNIKLPKEEDDFDHCECGLGSLFPMPGGLKENIEFFLGKSIHISKAEGFNVYEKLDEFAETDKELMPEIFDVLNCEEGCNIGTGCTHNQNVFKIDSIMHTARDAALKDRKKEYFDNLYKEYDKKFELQDFIREYHAIDAELPKITDKDIQKAFKGMNKKTFAQQNIDCGACGSDSCYQMARKIALNVNIPQNCIANSMELTKKEHEISLVNYSESLKYSKELQESKKRFETIWEHVECGIVIIDAETRKIVDINPIAMRMYGGEKEEVIGKYCQKVMCPAQKCPVLDLSQQVDRSERKFRNAAGEMIPIVKSVSKAVLNGHPVLIESFTDITSLKEAEEKARHFEVAERASHAKSDFLSRMSHEMRTPMNAIIGMTQIAGKTSDIDKLKHCLNMISNSSNHLLSLINDILDMSKIESGKFELHSGAINIEKMFIKISNLFLDKIEQKGINFSIILEKNMRLSYCGDDLRLSQVVTNLLSNAVKFTPDGGKIEIRVCESEKGDDYSVLRFSVRDNGIGMTGEQQSRLFNAFEQASSDTSRNFGGTGLGLAISKNIVELMNGRIWVESKLGEGSEFIFEVKLSRQGQQDGKLVFSNIRPGDVNLLVVDADEECRDYFKTLISGFGMYTDEAADADTAVGLIKKAKRAGKPYDIVFLDCCNPDQGQLAAIEKLSKIIDNNTCIVIMTTFLKWNKIENKVAAAGIYRLITKPLFPSAILNTICEVVGEAAKNAGIRIEYGNENQSPDFSDITILLAEDIDINREIFISLLEDSRATIEIAENGLIAYEKFKADSDKYDMIIMDVQMPEMDGYEATKSIRALDFKWAKKIPIIAMTANAFKEDIEKCLDSGMNDHLAKPIDIRAVNEKILQYKKISKIF